MSRVADHVSQLTPEIRRELVRNPLLLQAMACKVFKQAQEQGPIENYRPLNHRLHEEVILNLEKYARAFLKCQRQQGKMELESTLSDKAETLHREAQRSRQEMKRFMSPQPFTLQTKFGA